MENKATKELAKAIQQLSLSLPDTSILLKNANIQAIQMISDAVAKNSIVSTKIKTDIANKLVVQIRPTSDMTAESLTSIMKSNISVYTKMFSLNTTDMLTDLQYALINSEFAACGDIVSKTLQKSFLSTIDFSFLKCTDFINKIDAMGADVIIPSGLKSALKNTYCCTAARIENNSKLYYQTETSEFVVADDSNIRAKPSEMNVICSGADIFDFLEEGYITEEELMRFMEYLAFKPSFAICNEVGKKIHNIIKRISARIDFDCKNYYHSRALSNERENQFEYEEMLTAPDGMTEAGRFNFPGQSYFYFADTKNGSISEVLKHKKNCRIQTVVIKPIKSISMVDFSCDSKKGSLFLNRLRLPANINIRYPREYLIPNFVADCCKDCKIEGIKYFGTKEYSNYVCWKTDYFNFVRMEPIYEPKKNISS